MPRLLAPLHTQMRFQEHARCKRPPTDSSHNTRIWSPTRDDLCRARLIPDRVSLGKRLWSHEVEILPCTENDHWSAFLDLTGPEVHQYWRREKIEYHRRRPDPYKIRVLSSLLPLPQEALHNSVFLHNLRSSKALAHCLLLIMAKTSPTNASRTCSLAYGTSSRRMTAASTPPPQLSSVHWFRSETTPTQAIGSIAQPLKHGSGKLFIFESSVSSCITFRFHASERYQHSDSAK